MKTYDVTHLLGETDKLYRRITAKWPEKTKLALTAQKVIEERDWHKSYPLYKARMEQVLTALGFSFIPKIMAPGPVFVFPIRDVNDTYPVAQTKPLAGSELHGKAKYRFIGSALHGPRWLGNDRQTLQRIIETRTAVVVEGAFDLLAARLVSDTPILCPLTKKLGAKHIAYLRMLGVKRLYLMYDNERSGQGNMAMEVESYKLADWFDVQPLLCPASDPAQCLTTMTKAQELRTILQSVLPSNVSALPELEWDGDSPEVP